VAVLVAVVPLIVELGMSFAGWTDGTYPGFFVRNDRFFAPTFLEPDLAIPLGRVVEIDGHEVTSNADVYSYVRMMQPDTPVRYRFAAQGREREVPIPTKLFTWRKFGLTIGLWSCVALLFLVGGCTVALLRPSTKVASAFLVLGVANAAYMIGLVARLHPEFDYLVWMYPMGAWLLPVSLVHLGLLFPIERTVVERSPAWLVLPYGPAAILGMWATMQLAAEPPRFEAVAWASSASKVALAAVIGATAISYWRNRAQLVRPRVNEMTPVLVLWMTTGSYAFLSFAQGGGDLSMVLVSIAHPVLYLVIGHGIVRGDRFARDIVLQRTLELETQVRERTRELELALTELRHTQVALLQSEKMAALGQLTAGLTHEINTPVTAVVGNVKPLWNEIARLRDRAGLHGDATLEAIVVRLRAIVEVMARGAERTAGIVQDLRVFSRVGETTPLPMDLHEGIEVSLRLLRPRWVDRIEIHKDYGAVPVLEVAARQINQVLMNLLTNAFDAIAQTGNVWIRTRSDGTTVTVTVRDDGCGIAAEDAGRIFDPFFTTKPVGKGTGLGLAMSASIVRDHGGTLTLANDGDHGSTFELDLPLLPCEPGQQGASRSRRLGVA